MNVGALLIILLLTLSTLGIPIGYALGIATMSSLIVGNLSPIVLVQKTFTGMNSTALLAVPYFILAGNLMSGDVQKKLINFCKATVGRLPGSLGMITVVTSAIFAAISGSGVATVSAIGGNMIPAMEKDGYDKAFAGALASVASTLGPLIPPSLFLIVYGNATETSIGQLFMGALLPGICLAILLVFYVLFYAKKKGMKGQPAVSAKELGHVTLDGIWALFMPILVLGGIFLGIFTATEAAAVTCFYTMIVGLFIYRGLKPKDLLGVFSASGVTSATIMLLVGLSKASSYVIVTSKLPQMILGTFSEISSNPIIILLLINLLLLIVGMFMEGNAAIVMLTPLLMPLIKAMGISSVHFGVFMALNLCIGLVTPPVGNCLLLGNAIAGERLERTMKAAIPMIIISIAWLMVVTYVPAFSEWLPGLST